MSKSTLRFIVSSDALKKWLHTLDLRDDTYLTEVKNKRLKINDDVFPYEVEANGDLDDFTTGLSLRILLDVLNLIVDQPLTISFSSRWVWLHSVIL
jgi:hypothetical protein